MFPDQQCGVFVPAPVWTGCRLLQPRTQRPLIPVAQAVLQETRDRSPRSGFPGSLVSRLLPGCYPDPGHLRGRNPQGCLAALTRPGARWWGSPETRLRLLPPGTPLQKQLHNRHPAGSSRLPGGEGRRSWGAPGAGARGGTRSLHLRPRGGHGQRGRPHRPRMSHLRGRGRPGQLRASSPPAPRARLRTKGRPEGTGARPAAAEESPTPARPPPRPPGERARGPRVGRGGRARGGPPARKRYGRGAGSPGDEAGPGARRGPGAGAPGPGRSAAMAPPGSARPRAEAARAANGGGREEVGSGGARRGLRPGRAARAGRAPSAAAGDPRPLRETPGTASREPLRSRPASPGPLGWGTVCRGRTRTRSLRSRVESWPGWGEGHRGDRAAVGSPVRTPRPTWCLTAQCFTRLSHQFGSPGG